MNRTRLLLAALALATLAAAAPADARPASGGASGGPGGAAASGWLVLDPGPIDGAGVGFRLTFPVAPGVIHSGRVRDEFVLEPGIDFVHYEDHVGWYPYTVDYAWNGLLFVVGGAWNVWLTPHFALYPKIDLGWWYGWYSGWNDHDPYVGRYGYGRTDFDGGFLQVAGGLIYRFDRASLRVELGSGLVRVGAGVSF